MPAKIARLATRPPFWIPEVSVAVRSSRPSCSKAEKSRIFMADRQSSGESRIKPTHLVRRSADRALEQVANPMLQDLVGG